MGTATQRTSFWRVCGICVTLVGALIVVGCVQETEQRTPGEPGVDTSGVETQEQVADSQTYPDVLSDHVTGFLIEQDSFGAASSYTVVHPGQLVYLRSMSGNEIRITFTAGFLIDPATSTPLSGPLVLPADMRPIAVQISPDAGNMHTETLNVQAPGPHGSPTLIVRTRPIGSQ